MPQEIDRDRPDIETLDLPTLQGWGIHNYGYIGHLKRGVSGMGREETERLLAKAKARREELLNSEASLAAFVDFLKERLDEVEKRLAEPIRTDGFSEVACNVMSLDRGQDQAERSVLSEEHANYLLMPKLERGKKEKR